MDESMPEIKSPIREMTAIRSSLAALAALVISSPRTLHAQPVQGNGMGHSDGGNMMNHSGGGMGGWTGGGMWLWTAIGVLVVILLVVVTAKRFKK